MEVGNFAFRLIKESISRWFLGGNEVVLLWVHWNVLPAMYWTAVWHVEQFCLVCSLAYRQVNKHRIKSDMPHHHLEKKNKNKALLCPTAERNSKVPQSAICWLYAHLLSVLLFYALRIYPTSAIFVCKCMWKWHFHLPVLTVCACAFLELIQVQYVDMLIQYLHTCFVKI